MIEEQLRRVSRSGRIPGMDRFGNEPSHIHLPRRHRITRSGERGSESQAREGERRERQHADCMSE